MPGSPRVTVDRWAEVPAPAEQVWDLICDWAGMLRWWLPADQGGPPGPALIGCELIGEPASIPRTRRMTLSSGTVAEETIDGYRRHFTRLADGL